MYKHISIEKIVNKSIKQFYIFDKKTQTFDEIITQFDLIIDNLIDYCIKKKIIYFIENKINYSNITLNFKTHLINFLAKMVDPSGIIISKYIDNKYIDKCSDLNSLIFLNFKNKSFEKTVSFKSEQELSELSEQELPEQELYEEKIYTMKNYNKYNNGFDFNNSNKNNSKSNNINQNLLNIANEINIDISNLSIYIKLLIDQKKYLIEFTNELVRMCKILSDSNIKYLKSSPYD